ncbi:TetR family transcriptional regulator [Paenibacillus antibioticophila]|uniref:TetR family transcriptional regulator n=1 Tax=Paenibacillus antibioticophila TaxID=1274374 RepID=A0A919XY37_9BACL|nr:TetR/AcrR family transcriptional regulator [Paenibacillus antibioticophila]GIO38480.1 TetR family transcriptional regulator [Paenibacillus antibioticophila]
MTQTLNTRKKILQAAISLIKKKGFQGVTTREIARQANVNEVTVFRHFGNKMNILNTIIDEYSYIPSFEKVVHEEIRWNLKEDLQIITKIYFTFFKENDDVIKIAYKELGSFPELDKKITTIPLQLKELLVQYFDRMQKLNKIKECDSNAIAIAFISMNFGYLVSLVIHNHDFGINEEKFIDDSIQLFTGMLGF